MTSRVKSQLPTAVVAVLTLASGTLPGAATAWGASLTYGIVLAFSLYGSTAWRDPFELGRPARLLPLIVLLAVAASWLLSPVSRAGRTAFVLLPAFMLLPAAFANCWTGQPARQRGLQGLAGLVAVVSTIALLSLWLQPITRAAMPLGHHLLLAGWIVVMLPIVLGQGFTDPNRRWLTLGSAGLALLALLATGSLAAALAVAAQCMIAALLFGRWRGRLALLGLGCVAVAIPRISQIFEGSDLSTTARSAYLLAGWKGLVARPWCGWGPGSVAWQVSTFLAPSPDIHPPSQIVGDLHSMPAQVAFELGGIGTVSVLLLAATFIFRRLAEVRDATATTPQRSAFVGLIGAAIFALVCSPMAVPALPVAVALAIGLCLPPHQWSPARHRLRRISACYVIGAGLALLPGLVGQHLYDRARSAPSREESIRILTNAHRFDPGFPLYLARLAWLQAESNASHSSAARAAHQAAEMAQGLAPLWLQAGYLGARIGEPWADQALRHAQQLDPLSPLPPFLLMSLAPNDEDSVDMGVRAVRQAPDLAAARFWWDEPELARVVARESGISIPTPTTGPSTMQLLALAMDYEAATSFSIYAFRRSPWPTSLAPVVLWSGTKIEPDSGIEVE